MTAAVLTQFFALATIAVILAALFVLSPVESAWARSAERFLSGTAYGLTLAITALTLFTITNPH